jgi:hypothetical protein
VVNFFVAFYLINATLMYPSSALQTIGSPLNQCSSLHLTADLPLPLPRQATQWSQSKSVRTRPIISSHADTTITSALNSALFHVSRPSINARSQLSHAELLSHTPIHITVD